MHYHTGNTVVYLEMALALVFLFLFVFLFLAWTSSMDQQRDIAARTYELCVKAKYSVTPLAYFSEHGLYPQCP